MLALYLAYLDDESDKKLFEEIYLSHRKQMVILAITILGSEDDAQDAVGDVFLRIAQKNWDTVKQIKNNTDLRNYLLKATKNTALNKIKATKKDNVSLDTVIEFDISGIDNLTDNSFLDTVCTKFDYEKVLHAIGSLSEKYRDVLYCHFIMEITVHETAKALNQSVSATKQQLVRGKKMLLGLLDMMGDEKVVNEQRRI